MTDPIAVKVGQLWESEDPRCDGRRFEIIRVFGDTAWACNVVTGRTTMIRTARLRHSGKRGYQHLGKWCHA